MWKSFLQSMGLLAVAMLIALYSTNTARLGDSVTTIVAAVAALGIASWVAIRFVPQLARGVDWGWMPGLAQYRVTRDGGIFLLALFVVLAAAVNTSNNLLYMVLSALLAVVVLSALLSARNFKSLEMEVILPDRAFVGETLPVSVRVHNRKLALPAFSLSTELQGIDVYFPLIQPQGMALREGETRFSRRGRYTFEKLRTASRFPFGFFLKARHYPVAAECICYPKILPQDELEVFVSSVLGTRQRMERGLGSDLHTIRDYLPSDSARHVHWKATAKTATLKTREFATEDSPTLVLVFDRYGNPHDAERFEDLVSRAASIAFHWMRNGAGVTLISDEWESSADGSQTTLDEILGYLALVEMSPTAPPPNFEPQAGALLLSLRHERDSK
jgi:uncharacterized protein (DUF58 family)